MITIKKIFMSCIGTFVLSSCISIGKDINEISMPINDVFVVNHNRGIVSEQDSVILVAEMYPLIYHGNEGPFKTKCATNDTNAYYLVYKICLKSATFIDFSLISIEVTDINGEEISVCPYYGVPLSVNDHAFVSIDTIPFKMYTGISYIHPELGRFDHIATIFLEIHKPIKNINSLNISFGVDVDGDIRQYYAKYKKEWYLDIRPKLF